MNAKLVRVNPDARTVLIGSDAAASGPIRIAWAHDGTLGFWEGWSRAGDGLTWTISLGRAGEYEISIMAEGGKGKPAIEVSAGGQKFRARLSPRWERIVVGKAYLPGGRSEVSLRSAKGRPMQRFYSLEMVRPEVRLSQRRLAQSMRADAAWMVRGIYGLMFHWTTQTWPRRGAKKPYHKAVADFAVEPFADMVADTGAGHVYLTTTHADHYFPGPNDAIDRILPGRTCRRDLIGEIAEALEARGVRLGLYYHLGHDDKRWWNRVGWDKVGKAKFYRAWCDVVSDSGRRYGSRLAGWWFDDALFSYYPINPPWERLMRAARKGWAQRLIMWNSWNAPKVTDFADLSSWEPFLTADMIARRGHLTIGGDGRFTGGPQDGLQAQLTTLIHSSWGHGKPNTPVGKCVYTTPQLIRWLRQAARKRAVITLNLETYQDGTICPADVRRFRAIRKAIKPYEA